MERGLKTATRRASKRGAPRVPMGEDPSGPSTLPDSSTKDPSGRRPRGEGLGLKLLPGGLKPSSSSSGSGAPT